MITLEAWQSAVAKRGYALVFLKPFDPLSQPGCIECSYSGEPTEIEYYFSENPEIPAPTSLANTQRALAEFRINTRYGETAWFAAVAAAAALCIATDGVIEDDDCAQFSARKAAAWARGILHADEELAKKALAYPHPDTANDPQRSGSAKPWWRFW